MRVQFRCCLCGQTNVTDVDPVSDRVRARRGLFARLFGWIGPRKTHSASARYVVECEFCHQNNAISAPQRPARP
jgi:hypothetical protein